MRAQRRLRRKTWPGLRAHRALLTTLCLVALAVVVGARLPVWHAAHPPTTSVSVRSGPSQGAAPESPSAAARTAFRWVHLRVPVTYSGRFVGPQAPGHPGSIHITFPREWQPITFEVGGPASLKPDVRLVCGACSGVNWVFHRPEDYSLEEGLLVDAATFGVIEIAGGSEQVIEWHF